MKPAIWAGCYDEGWKGLITPEAFAHPAKFSRGLIKRILNHMLARGYVARGDTIGDPFGGIGTGGIEAAYRGLRWVGVELEGKFVGLANKNFELHGGKWDTLGLQRPVIVQGDSRRFDVAVSGVVTSPPFTQGYSGGGGINKNGYTSRPDLGPDWVGKRTYQGTGADRAADNIEVLKDGDLDAVISSPPYSDISAGAGGLNTKPAKNSGQQGGRKNGASQDTDQRYGDDAAQIAKLQDRGVEAVITSPPYADSFRGGEHDGIDWDKAREAGADQGLHGRGSSVSGDYGKTPGQIGTLKESGSVDSVVTSPPYEDSINANRAANDSFARAQRKKNAGMDVSKSIARGGPNSVQNQPQIYGDQAGQIGREAGETYWQAMLQVYSACYRSIKPGGYIAVVVKDYVKNKARVPLCDDTLRLLCHVGFTPIERIHAMLVEETAHAQLFGADHVTRKERKSFFRRLAEKKGSPRIDYEEVLICRRPE